MKRQISIILVNPENPDNIGAVARAMKNMALEDLRLVRPPANWRIRGRKMAMSARDVLERARVYPSLKAALANTHLVFGTTRRRGPRRGMLLPYEQAVQKIRDISLKKQVAILFGKESKGLDNASLRHCDWVMTIPANAVYPSLNLAQAVMVIAFSIARPDLREIETEDLISNHQEMIPKKEVETVLAYLKKALVVLDYPRAKGLTERVLGCWHRLFKRSGLLESEAQMFKGLSRRIVEKTGNRKT